MSNHRLSVLEGEIRADIKRKVASKQFTFLTPIDTASSKLANHTLHNPSRLTRKDIFDLGNSLTDVGLSGSMLLNHLGLIFASIPTEHPDEDKSMLEEIKRVK